MRTLTVLAALLFALPAAGSTTPAYSLNSAFCGVVMYSPIPRLKLELEIDRMWTRYLAADGTNTTYPATHVNLAVFYEFQGGAMRFTFAHNNINVLDLDRSLAFYREALGLQEVRRIAPPDGSFIIVYLGDGATTHRLELTWLRDRTEPYNLGDNEIHLALRTDDFAAAHARHEQMGCICYENPGMGIYFISDPDGYWTEILPPRR